MKQLKQLLLVMAIALTGFTPAQAQTWTHYSEWMANTQKSYVYQKSSGNDYWRYDDGLMYESILDTYEHYKNGGSDIGDATLKNAVKSYIDNCVNSSGSITNYESTTLDDIRPARMVYKYFKLYGGENLKTACRTVLNCNAFKDDVRVISQSTGYPWQHKGDYAHQVWLDGIFMGLPYWTLAGPDTEITSTIHGSWTANDYFDDAVSQMQITDEKTYEPTNGLWCHAWDATSPISFFWATKTGGFLTNEFKSKHSPYELVAHNGRSSHCWGRALGWFAMAIMETMDNIAKVNGASDSRITTLKALFKKVMDKVVETRDPSAGVWRCVIDVDATQAPYKDYSTKNNYLEATCSAMFTYCLLHGVAQGYLDSSYLPIAKDAYNKFITEFIDDTGTNLIMSNCMSVGGLDNDKKGDTKRDGSYAYYMSESMVDNDSKGVGPFIWASLEAEKTYGYTITDGFSKRVASDDIVQFRWSRVADDFTLPNTTPASYVSPTFTAKTHGGSIFDNATSITFSSDNTAVATVDANGTITLAGEAGTANIKATMTSGAYVGEAIYTVTTTGADTTAPTLESSTPATGATGVAVSGHITLTFSEDVTIVDASKFTLTGGAGTLDKEHATTDGATITIPYSGLANSTTYTLNIAGDAVKDLSGNTNEAVNAITFTTIAPDLTAPSLSGHSITDGATDVATSGTIVLTFSEDVACTTNATLTPAGGSAINLTPTVSGSTVTYSYSGLSNSTSYTFNLPANSVTDLAGNKYTSAINITFTTTTETDKYYILAYTEMTPAGVLTSASNSNQSLKYVKYNGSTFATTSEISSDFPSNKNGKYSNANITNILNSSNWASGSGSSYATGIVLSKNTTYTLNLGSNNISKISFLCYPAGNTSSISIGGTAKTTSTKEWTLHEWAGSFTGNVSITLSNANDIYGVFVLEKASGSTPPTPTTFTLNNTVNTSGYGTVSPESVANIPSGTAVTAGTGDNINKFTVGETTVTATPATATAEYTYAFSGWSNLPSTVTANATVTANFTRTAKEYTLAWNSNGGSALSGDYTSGTVAFGTAITAPNNPTRDGYTFNGWKSAQDGSGTAPTGTMPAANTTYYAQWVVEGEETSETVTPTGIDSSKNLTFSSETNLVVYLPNGSMEDDEAKFKGDAAIDISSVGSKYIKEIVITYDATSSPNIRHPENANDLTIKNVTSNGSVVISGSVLGSVTSTTSSPYTTTWSDNSGAKNINKVTLNYANNSHSLYISNIKVTYWGASETPTVEAPTFTAHPANATYTQGDTPTALSVTATGNPAPTYRWYKNTDNDKTAKVADQIEGATAATLPVANISTATAGTFYYYCVATNSEGTATSNSATITVNAPALAISTQPVAATYTQNATASALSVTATGGSTPYSYQWYSNDTNDTETPTAVGNNSDSYTPSTATVGTTYYYCIVTDNASETVTSNIVAVTVNAAASHDAADPAVVDKSGTDTYGNHVFLDVANTATNKTITEGSIACLTYCANYLTATMRPTWLTDSKYGTSSQSYGDFTSDGFLPRKSGSPATISEGYGGVNIRTGNYVDFYITGTTDVTILAKNNSSSKKIQISVYEIKANNSETQVESTIQGTTTDVHVLPFRTALDAAKFYKVRVDAASDGSNSVLCQIRFIPGSSFTPRTTTATIKANKRYATYNTTMDIDFDQTEGLQAFIVDNATKSSIHLTEVHKAPVSTALILKGNLNVTATDYTLYETNATTDNVTSNLLTISNSTVAADNKYYALGTVNGVQGFHRVQNGLTIPTSYVIITDQTAKSFLNFEEEENIATGIDGFATANGFIVIDDNTPLYNLSGQRVSKSYKGIVIVNGKKVLRK